MNHLEWTERGISPLMSAHTVVRYVNFFNCILKCDKVSEETIQDGNAFQQLIQRFANVLARALVGYNFWVNLSPCPLVLKE